MVNLSSVSNMKMNEFQENTSKNILAEGFFHSFMFTFSHNFLSNISNNTYSNIPLNSVLKYKVFLMYSIFVHIGQTYSWAFIISFFLK